MIQIIYITLIFLLHSFTEIKCEKYHIDRNKPIDYLSYEVINNEQIKEEVFQKIQENIKILSQIYKEINVYELIDKIKNEYELVFNYHITLAFLGGMSINQALQQNFTSEIEQKRWMNLLNNFEEEKQIEGYLMGFTIIEDKLITGFAFLNQDQEQLLNIRSVNENPHMTFYTNKWTAVDSNFVLQQIFSPNNPYHLQYSQEFFQSNQIITKKINIDSQNQWENNKNYQGKGYLISFANKFITIKLKTYCHYS